MLKDSSSPLARLLLSVILTLLALGTSLLLPVGAELESKFPRQTASPAPAAPPAQVKVVAALPAYIASKWRLEEARAKRLVEFSTAAAKSVAVDPLLVLAVIAQESAFRYVGNPGDLSIKPEAVDPLRPHGLMQVSGKWHPEKMPLDKEGNIRVTTSRENIDAGVRVLSEYMARERGDLVRALQRYNGNLADTDARYAQSVLRMRDEFQAVASDA